MRRAGRVNVTRGLWALVLVIGWATGLAAAPRNVVLLIGDGMGFPHVRAASLFAYGEEGRLFMEQLPVHGTLATHPADGKSVPDSANTGTALATGHKVQPGILSVLPARGKGEDRREEQILETILERFAKAGKSTGLVSSESIGGATPAAFSAHVRSRKMYDEIYRWHYERTRPNLLWGGGWQQPVEDARAAGYRIITTRAEMLSLDPAKDTHVAGRFSPSDMPYEYDYMLRIDPRYDRVPHLSEMAAAAVRYLAGNGQGFFLMIEGGTLDHAAHKNDLERTVFEVLEFDNAAKEVMRWAVERTDTLVVVTSDHECGGLKVNAGRGRGEMPEAAFTTGGHTRDDVPLYAWGVGAEALEGKLDNTDVPKRIEAAPAEGEVRDAEGRKGVKWKLMVSY